MTSGLAAQAREMVREGFSLPAYYYMSEERYQEDEARLLEKSWWLAGHVSQIKNRGDHFLFNIGSESIIINRGNEGEVNAFYNVCRHRGSRICLEKTGSSKMMVCPYHAWSYNSSGKLIGSPEMPASFDKSEYGLRPAHLGLFEGLIFVCLAEGEPPSFDAHVDRMRPFMAPYKIEHTKVIAQENIGCPANWKVVAENFAECYHCGNSHREYVKNHDINAAVLFDSDSDVAVEWRERIARIGFPTTAFADEADSFDYQAAACLKIGGEHLSGGKSGKPMAPRLGELSEWSGSWQITAFSPLCQTGCYDDHIILFTFVPRGPVSTDCIVTWLVREDAVEGRDYDPAEVSFMWSHTIREDKTICANNQLGVASRAYQPGPYSTTEDRAAGTVDWYLRHFVDRAAETA